MTELYIDGTSVVLPADFSTSVKRENPFFTKNGEYTYDITLQLSNSINADLYAHLNRLNSISELKTKRQAVLVADNRVYCNGTEIITGWTDSTVSIQIASGNSELNSFIGNDLLVSSLDMGEDEIPTGIINNLVKRIYPDVDYCIPPVMTDKGVINGWRVAVTVVTTSKPTISPNYLRETGVDIYLQPYLCAYIRKLMKALGYTVLTNQLEDSEWNLLYLPQNGHPNQYAKMFPGWTINELITEFESFFNLCFLVNNRKKEVSILFRAEYFKNAQVCHVQQVVDEYETEEGENDKDPSQSNVLIESTDSEYYKPQHIDKNILSSATRKDFDTVLEFTQFVESISSSGYQAVKNYLFYTHDSCRYYITVPDDSNRGWHTAEVNMFGDVLREQSENEIKLNIMPSDMTNYGIERITYESGMEPVFMPDSERSLVTVPKISGSKIGTSDESNGIYELIQSGEDIPTEKDKNQQKLYVSYYKGMSPMTLYVKRRDDKDFNPKVFTIDYPHSFNCEDTPYTGNLRLAYLDKMLYSRMYDIDYKHGIKIKSYDVNVYDTRNIFEIRNKRYVCKEIEDVINAHGRSGAWQGTFYPIRISDVEAEKRWILTDGKWRDGGIWLDSGRWLDG